MHSVDFQISIITVTLNNLEGLRRTLNSVLAQKNDLVEYVIIDGGSNDGTLSFLNTNSEKINKYISEKDNGIYDAMNKGALLSQGRYLLFLNSGDELCNCAINLYNSEINISHYDFYYGQIYLKNGNESESKYEIKIPNYHQLGYGMSIFHPSTLISKTQFFKLGMYDCSFRLAADYNFFLKAYIKNASFKYINKPLAIYESGGFSSQNANLSLIENIKIKFQILPFYKSLPNILYSYIKFYGIIILRNFIFIILGSVLYKKTLNSIKNFKFF
jgi:glycosyltransferase involved in cell wall biosynthesis